MPGFPRVLRIQRIYSHSHYPHVRVPMGFVHSAHPFPQTTLLFAFPQVLRIQHIYSPSQIRSAQIHMGDFIPNSSQRDANLACSFSLTALERSFMQ